MSALVVAVEVEPEGREVQAVLQQRAFRRLVLDAVLEALQAVLLLEVLLSQLLSSPPTRP